MIKAWLKLHAKQLVTLALWLAAMVAIHYRPTMRDELVVAASALFAVGIQLPPFTLKSGVEAATKIVTGTMLVLFAFALLVAACTTRQEAKNAYLVQSQACFVAYDDPPHQKLCVEYVRNRWTEAGAPPAADLDGGSHE